MSERPDADAATSSGALSSVAGLFDAIVARDAVAIADAYAPRDDLLVFVEGPRWQTVGHAAVTRGWRDFCRSGPRLEGVTFTDGPYMHCGPGGEGAGIASVSGTVRLRVGRADGGHEAMPMRMTWVLVRDQDRWRIVHEHASQPLADPYGTGDWLREDSPA